MNEVLKHHLHLKKGEETERNSGFTEENLVSRSQTFRLTAEGLE